MGRTRGKPHRSRLKIARDRREIAQRALRGETQAAIGAAIGLTQQAISLEFKRIQQAWVLEAVDDVATARAQELARIDQLERTYWAAWEASKGEQHRRTQIVRPGAGTESRPEDQVLTVQTEEAVGDKRWLAGIQWCIEKRMAIFGLAAAPQRPPAVCDEGALRGSVTHYRR